MYRLLTLLACLALAACSADAAPEPEPDLETPGAFFAIRGDNGDYPILRTLGGIDVTRGEDVLFCMRYAPPAPSFEEAEELARNGGIHVVDELALLAKDEVLAREWRVVWFRTLTDEERGYLP